jgi:hypothetical protein
MMENVRTISDQDLIARCQEFGKKARKWKNRFVALLPEVSKRGLHRKKGFATIIEFAAKVGGVGRSTVEAIFRVDRILKDKPELKAMVAEVGVNKVRAVASIATKKNEKELVNLVQTMSKPALEMYVRDEKAHEQATRPGTGNIVIRERMSFSVDENIALEMRKIKLRMEKERKEAIEWNDVMQEMVKAMDEGKRQKKEQNQSSKNPEIVDQKVCKKLDRKEIINRNSSPRRGKVSRYIIAEKRHNLDDKYHGKCGHSDCNKPATEIHHIEGFAQVHNHNKIIPLCHEHHELKHYEMPESPWQANEIAKKSLVKMRE